ncbi:MAG: TetR/AcrR family transcriptional regulator [Holdemanella sp.]|nr:TetR/AcrR family transcriptional regulator [Holdemanella sp.]
MKNTRKDIVNTAMKLYKEKGYDNTTVNDICKHAHITKGTFYYHFPNKDEIAFEFYNQLFDDFSEKLIDILMIPDEKEQLWKVYEYSIDRTIALTPSVLYPLIMSDIQNGFDLFSPYKSDNYESGRELTHKLILNITKKGQQTGKIRQGDPVTMTTVYQSALMGIAIAWARSDGSFDEKEELKKAFDLIY